MNISSVGSTAGYSTDRAISNGPDKRIVAEKIEAATSSSQASHLPINDEQQKQLKNLEKVIQAIQSPETTIERSVHEGTNQVVYKVKDRVSGEILKQIPEEKLLDVAVKIMELAGIIIDERI
jgi:flagellar protein FlaG